MPTVTLTNADHGKTIQLRQGEEIVVRLPENPTTGYRWFLERIERPITKESDTYEAVPPIQIGSGGVHEFRFRAAAPGATRLALKHWQEWEGERSVVERFAVDIQVSD